MTEDLCNTFRLEKLSYSKASEPNTAFEQLDLSP